MKKAKLTVLALTLILAVAVVAGCGSSDSKPQAQAPQVQMAMPSGDPMPMMKDMDKNLQDMMRQVKAGQMMDAQKSAGQIASIADKVMPHMTDNAMRDQMKKAANDLREAVSGAKVEQTAVESRMQAMQDIMKRSVNHLQAQKHNH